MECTPDELRTPVNYFSFALPQERNSLCGSFWVIFLVTETNEELIGSLTNEKYCSTTGFIFFSVF